MLAAVNTSGNLYPNNPRVTGQMKTTLAAILSATLIPTLAFASFPERSSIKDYYDSSEYVVFAQVESGAVHRIGGDSCGAQYTITVSRAFKGTLADRVTITGGPTASPIEVGSSYLLFLSTKKGFDRRKVADFYGMPENWLDACKRTDVFLQPTIMLLEDTNAGVASLVVPERIVKFPDNVPTTCSVSVLGSSAVLEPAHVNKEDAFSYLEELKNGAPDT